MIIDKLGLAEVNSRLEEKLKVIKKLDRSNWNPFKEDSRKNIEKRIDYDILSSTVDSINAALFDARYSDKANAVEIRIRARFKRYIKHLPGPGTISNYRHFLEEFLKLALNRKRFPGTAEYTFYKGLTENEFFKYIKDTPEQYKFHIHKQSIETGCEGFFPYLKINLNESEHGPDGIVDCRALIFADEIESIKLVNIDNNKLTPNFKRRYNETGVEYFLE
jgi:hypothetical protein